MIRRYILRLGRIFSHLKTSSLFKHHSTLRQNDSRISEAQIITSQERDAAPKETIHARETPETSRSPTNPTTSQFSNRSKSKPTKGFSDLPAELVTQISSHLDSMDTICFALTNKGVFRAVYYSLPRNSWKMEDGRKISKNEYEYFDLMFRLRSFFPKSTSYCIKCKKYVPGKFIAFRSYYQYCTCSHGRGNM